MIALEKFYNAESIYLSWMVYSSINHLHIQLSAKYNFKNKKYQKPNINNKNFKTDSLCLKDFNVNINVLAR